MKAVHEYAATDNDELELTIGDMVLVLAFDNPDEQVSPCLIFGLCPPAPCRLTSCALPVCAVQDDGWLLGLKESHWLQNKDISAKGVFPENFTQKV